MHRGRLRPRLEIEHAEHVVLPSRAAAPSARPLGERASALGIASRRGRCAGRVLRRRAAPPARGERLAPRRRPCASSRPSASSDLVGRAAQEAFLSAPARAHGSPRARRHLGAESSSAARTPSPRSPVRRRRPAAFSGCGAPSRAAPRATRCSVTSPPRAPRTRRRRAPRCFAEACRLSRAARTPPPPSLARARQSQRIAASARARRCARQTSPYRRCEAIRRRPRRGRTASGARSRSSGASITARRTPFHSTACRGMLPNATRPFGRAQRWRKPPPRLLRCRAVTARVRGDATARRSVARARARRHGHQAGSNADLGPAAARGVGPYAARRRPRASTAAECFACEYADTFQCTDGPPPPPPRLVHARTARSKAAASNRPNGRSFQDKGAPAVERRRRRLGATFGSVSQAKHPKLSEGSRPEAAAVALQLDKWRRYRAPASTRRGRRAPGRCGSISRDAARQASQQRAVAGRAPRRERASRRYAPSAAAAPARSASANLVGRLVELGAHGAEGRRVRDEAGRRRRRRRRPRGRGAGVAASLERRCTAAAEACARRGSRQRERVWSGDRAGADRARCARCAPVSAAGPPRHGRGVVQRARSRPRRRPAQAPPATRACSSDAAAPSRSHRRDRGARRSPPPPPRRRSLGRAARATPAAVSPPRAPGASARRRPPRQEFAAPPPARSAHASAPRTPDSRSGTLCARLGGPRRGTAGAAGRAAHRAAMRAVLRVGAAARAAASASAARAACRQARRRRRGGRRRSRRQQPMAPSAAIRRHRPGVEARGRGPRRWRGARSSLRARRARARPVRDAPSDASAAAPAP